MNERNQPKAEATCAKGVPLFPFSESIADEIGLTTLR
jgi:hypothetical protein